MTNPAMADAEQSTSRVMIIGGLIAIAPLIVAGAVRAAAILPEDGTPYLLLMVGGFAIGIAGHVFRARWIVAVGILLIFLATFLLPIATILLNEEPNPPGPDVPVEPAVLERPVPVLPVLDEESSLGAMTRDGGQADES